MDYYFLIFFKSDKINNIWSKGWPGCLTFRISLVLVVTIFKCQGLFVVGCTKSHTLVHMIDRFNTNYRYYCQKCWNFHTHTQKIQKNKILQRKIWKYEIFILHECFICWNENFKIKLLDIQMCQSCQAKLQYCVVVFEAQFVHIVNYSLSKFTFYWQCTKGD